MNYYNEFDPFAAQWLRKLIEAGLIPQGDVDDRSIVDVRGDDLRGYEQCHFFAGIGGWAYALELAGWEGEVWTGSCPCQPFSVAGSGKGTADERHLWPAWFELIKQCNPRVIFGEQVAAQVVTGKEIARSRLPAGLPPEESLSRPDSPRSISGTQTAGSLRPRFTRRGNPEAYRSGLLRTNGLGLQLGWWEDVGQPFARQDRPEAGIRDCECEGDSPCSQQCARGLGRGDDASLGEGCSCQAPRCFECALRKAREETEREVGHLWLAGVSADLESEGYRVGACDVPAAGVTAPHIRQRLYWVADAAGDRNSDWRQRSGRTGADINRADGGLADAGHAERGQGDRPRASSGRDVLRPERQEGATLAGEHGQDAGRLADHDGPYRTGEAATVTDSDEQDGRVHRGSPGRVGDTCGDGGSPGLPGPQQGQERLTGVPHYASRECAAWDNFRIIECGDGKYRRIPVEPALFPLVDGVPNRVGTLRGAGNAIVPPLGAEFVQAFMEIDAR